MNNPFLFYISSNNFPIFIQTSMLFPIRKRNMWRYLLPANKNRHALSIVTITMTWLFLKLTEADSSRTGCLYFTTDGYGRLGANRCVWLRGSDGGHGLFSVHKSMFLEIRWNPFWAEFSPYICRGKYGRIESVEIRFAVFIQRKIWIIHKHDARDG